MTQRKKPAATPSRDRVVYEVRGPNIGTRQVDAATTAELRKALTPLGLDPYTMQAAAHLAHNERATVQGKGWSIKRLGVLSFVPDSEGKPATAQRRPAPQTPTAPNADDAAQVQGHETPDAPQPQYSQSQQEAQP